MRWHRLGLTVGLAFVWLFWLRDAFRLSRRRQLEPAGPPLDLRPAVFRWDGTAPALASPAADANPGDADSCRGWSAQMRDEVQIVLKTGAAEEPARLQSWLAALGNCLSNLLIFSDAAGRVGQHEIYDALEILPAAYAHESNPDFGAYGEQARALAGGTLREHDTTAGWRLDRFKFLPMVYLARRKRPGAKWYVFVETDTFVSWDNLLRFLSQFDADAPLYLGSPLHSPDDDSWFAYGGSGIVLSHAAIDRLLSQRKEESDGEELPEVYARQKWIDELKHDVYGESVLGKALHEAGVPLTGFYPLFYPMNLASISFGAPDGKGVWCEPVITMHKLSDGRQYQELAEWEMRGDAQQVSLTTRQAFEIQPDTEPLQPFLFRDLFAYVQPHNVSARADWDNLSRDECEHASAHASPDACRQACLAEPRCLQFAFHHDRCFTSPVVSLGGPRAPEALAGRDRDRTTFVSGWLSDRIEAWAHRPDAACELGWIEASVDRRWGA